MTSPVWSSLIAVGGTLAGSATVGVVQLLSARQKRRAERDMRREDRRETRRAEAVVAVVALAAAVSDHRRAMWQFEDAKLTDQSGETVTSLLAAQHDTRSAINAPMTTLALLAPDLADAAREAARATYAMRNAPNMDVLEARRALASAAHDEFVAAAAGHLEDADLVVTVRDDRRGGTR